MKKYLITGGAGFIGSNLVRKLVSHGKKVILIVEQGTDLWRLQDIITKVKIYKVSLLEFGKIKSLIIQVKPDVIFHLAAYGVFTTQRDQKKLYDVNFYGTVNLFNCCKGVGFDCFVNTGSCSEYGTKDEAMKESDLLEPVDDYGVSKAASTHFCLKEALFNNMPVYTARPFTVYGNFEMIGRLIPSIFVNVLNNQPIDLSEPSFVRDFIYVEDVVDFYIKLSEKRPQEAYIFNVGTGVQHTLGQVIDIVQSLCDKKITARWGKKNPRPWEPKVWQASIDQAKHIVGWKPKYTLEDGLERSFEWFKQNLHLYKVFIDRVDQKSSRV